MLLKGVTLHHFKNNFAEIIKNMDYYWPLSKGDESTQKKSKMYLNFAGNLSKLIIFWFGSTTVSLFITTFFYNSFVIKVWIPDHGLFGFIFVKCMEVGFLYFGILIVAAFDLFYINITFQLMVQFQLIASAMKTTDISDANRNRNFIETIEQHNHLLK